MAAAWIRTFSRRTRAAAFSHHQPDTSSSRPTERIGPDHVDTPKDVGLSTSVVEARVIALVPREIRLLDPEPAWTALRNPDGAAPVHLGLRAENDRRLAHFLDRVEVLLTPTTPGPPHGHAGPGARINTSLTWAFNLSGHPAVSIPAGFVGDRGPVGLQLVTRHGAEGVLFRVAAALERLAPWPFPDLRVSGRPAD